MRHIFKSYDKKRFILEDLDFCLKKGEIATIYGASGSGKSTFLNGMGFLDCFNAGEYYFFGDNVDIKKINRYKQYRASDIGFIFQSYCLIDALSVEDNIKMPYLYMQGKSMMNNAEMYDVLERLQLLELRGKAASTLSGGEKQRVAIARALLKKPKLIIADEPTGNLDENNSNIVSEAFRNVAKMGTSLVVVTHNKYIEFSEGNKYILGGGKLSLC